MDDFYSDTKTRPSRAMREAALAAEVGDEQKGEDPTTAALEARVAALLGKEAAVFLPSGTMCNEIALMAHLRPGDEVICWRDAHLCVAEAGGPAALAGAMICALDAEDGQPSPEQVRAAIRSGSRYEPASRLVWVEQTANLAGGTVWPVEKLDAVAAVAKAHGLATHMDGARLMNAVVASGRPAHEHAAGWDSVWVDFSKGLGAPVGAALAGSRDFIAQAWRLKQRIGGAMRQSGMLAAMALHGLERNVARLAEDHALAAWIAQRLAQVQGIVRVVPPQTNLVFCDLAEDGPDAATLAAALREDGIQISLFGPRRIRIVTHLDVDRAAAERLVAALARRLDRPGADA